MPRELMPARRLALQVLGDNAKFGGQLNRAIFASRGIHRRRSLLRSVNLTAGTASSQQADHVEHR
jgi:hypothetical protein